MKTTAFPRRISRFLHKRSPPHKESSASTDSVHFRSISITSEKSDPWDDGSKIFWRTPRSRLKLPILRHVQIDFSHPKVTPRYVSFFLSLVMFGLLYQYFNPLSATHNSTTECFDCVDSVHAVLSPVQSAQIDPMQWLQQNSHDKHAASSNILTQLQFGRPRAAMISLVRNSEVAGMVQSIEELEYRWNRKYQYPWIFFNDQPFSDEFKEATQNATSAKCYYAVVPEEHWSLPSWIDESRFMNGLEYLGTIGVGKGWLISYHHMCRWNSGFFYNHPILKEYDWYWRVEPDIHYFCDIDYDIFRFMQDNNLKYGFNMNILDDARSFPSLWSHTSSFLASNPALLHPSANLSWLIDTNTSAYNNCQFFSNFEIGNLNFWRGEAHEKYFKYLDRKGGFYYERWGDAPVHTLSVAMFLERSEVWWFRDVGYRHDICSHCPSSTGLGIRIGDGTGNENGRGRCECERTGLDENFYKLVPRESRQRKPDDTCIRLWLGGKWLEKREGWTAEGERAFGGDGYHGYKILGDE